MKTYRFRIEGSGVDKEGERIGFFTTRQVRAISLEEGRVLAEDDFEREWLQEGRPGLSRVDDWRVIDGWRLRWAWFRRAPRGFVFYRGDDAEEAALDLDTKVFGSGRRD